MSFTIASTSNKDVALSLASRGLHVFPCNTDKTPRIEAWEQNATASPFAIATKWGAYPDALPGLPVGAHGLLVIDADRHADGPDGVAAFNALCKEHSLDQGAFFVVATPSNGFHFYFKTETSYGLSTGTLPDGIHVRGSGGYVIGPGATLPDGRGYRHVHGSWDAIPALPDALASLLSPKAMRAASAASNEPQNATDREKTYAAAGLASDVDKLSHMTTGMGRNAALNTYSHSAGTMVGAGWLDADTAVHELTEAAIANGHVAKHGMRQTEKTIESGLNAGIAKPRSPLPVDDSSFDDLRPMIANGIAGYKASQSSKPAKEWPAELNADAYIGIAGDFIRLVAPHTEGDPCALLVAFLTVVGSIMGRGAHLPVGPTMHYPNLFSVIVAETSKGRKGTVMAEAKRFAKMIDPTISTRMLGGLSSGEGLIEAVRDARRDDSPAKESKSPIPQLVDNGVSDKRLLVTESEMGQALQAAGRDGNTLSATLRMAWDGDELRTLARSNKNVCREPHISIFGNITLDELQRLLTSTDRNNGFGNLFLWVCARRSQELPWGGNVEDVALQELAVGLPMS